MKKLTLFVLVSLVLLVLVTPLQAEDQITYVSQPDEVYIFLNNIAFARDEIALPAGVNARLVLPGPVYENTLRLLEDGQRVSSYRLRRVDNQVTLEWTTSASDGARQVTLEYLLSGLSWTPRYDMLLNGDPAETVDYNFFAEIQNTALDLETVKTHLIAGRVDTDQQINSVAQMSMNQALVGYENAAPGSSDLGAATIQYIYEPGTVSSAPGEMVYQQLMEATLPARRVLLWNAETDQQVSVIYKVRNDSDIPLTDGSVRSYQNGIFIGSDSVEVTPVGSEGSITVGKLQDVRVTRTGSQTSITGLLYNYQYVVEMKLENFSAQPVTIEVVDRQHPEAELMTFSTEPERETGNILRWTVTLEPGQSTTIHYEFQTK